MPRLIVSILVCISLLAVLESGLRTALFHHASYSNSESIDAQLAERDASPHWNILLVGDSEVRWGIHPQEIDEAFRDAGGIEARTFNHAFDGFGASWWPVLLPPLLRHPSLEHVKIVALGVQMIDAHQIIQHTAQCGALQEPVLTSAFGGDLGLRSFCRSESWDAALGNRLFSWLWTVRYAPAIKSLLLPGPLLPETPLRFNSRKSGEPFHGFEPHYAIAHDRGSYAEEFGRWKAQYAERDFQPLSSEIWMSLTSAGGFFDRLRDTVNREGRELVLFAAPTNPVIIDTFGRRDDYATNSLLLKQWAVARRVPFLDLGIQDVESPDSYFSDMRHLSGEGARLFSRQLGTALVHSLSSPTIGLLADAGPPVHQ